MDAEVRLPTGKVGIIAIDLLDPDDRSLDLQGVGGAVEVTEFETAPSASDIDRSLIGADTIAIGAYSGARTGAVLQFDFHAIQHAVVSLAVRLDNDLGFKFELAAGAAGTSVVIVEAREKLCVATQRDGQFSLGLHGEGAESGNRNRGEKNFAHLYPRNGSRPYRPFGLFL